MSPTAKKAAKKAAASPPKQAPRTTFTITSPRTCVLSPVAGDDQAVRLVAGEPVEVSEHQAVAALNRPDLDVAVPDGYGAELAACAP